MSAFSDNMVPDTKRAFIFSAALAGVAVVLYLFAVQPCEDSIAKAKRDLSALEDQQRTTERDLRESPKVKSLLAEIDKARQPFLDALLTPLLESWAMRAKSLLDPLAADVGVKVLDYVEVPVRALPLLKPVPRQLYARRPIRVICEGSYAEIASFVLRIEKMLPYVSVQSVTITAQTSPDVQKGTIVVEWPAKGALSVPGGAQ